MLRKALVFGLIGLFALGVAGAAGMMLAVRRDADLRRAELEAKQKEAQRQIELRRSAQPVASAAPEGPPLRLTTQRPLTMAEARALKTYDEKNAQARLVAVCAKARQLSPQLKGSVRFLRHAPTTNWPTWSVKLGLAAECVITDSGYGPPYERKAR
jgi:hypothetical protein